MKQSFPIYLLAISTLAVSAFGSGAVGTPQEEFKIMLQGSSAAEMRELVLANGGIVTHDLPIINAVGARVTRECLDDILESPKVDRYLDDLSTSDQPDPVPTEPEQSCDVGGALEADISHQKIQWRLYNKKEKAAQLSQLTLGWPEKFGTITKIQLGQAVLQLPPAQDRVNPFVLNYDKNDYPEVATASELTVHFNSGDSDEITETHRQRDFSLEAQFVGGCATKLVPGYANNDENTYFPSVVGADSLHQHGITGRGVTVAIIDSGLWEHEALVNDTRGKNRLVARYDAIADVSNETAFDESGHGTHMASVLAHSGQVTDDGVSTGSFKGIAPDANLVAVKAFDIEGHGDFLDLVRAIQFVVDHRDTYNIKVLNLSFAARPRWIYWLDPINQAIMRAWAAGITVVAAAGNEGPDSMTIGSPGNLPYVITVGAVTDSWTIHTRDDDYIPDFSSRGPTPDAHIKPDIVAPGGHMTGLIRPGSTLTQEHPDYYLKSGEFVMTGSSQASALVSGIAALLLQLEPDLSPDDIKCKLTSSAELAINSDGLLAYSPFQQGSGYVSATRAITLGQRGCGNAGLDIQKDIEGVEHFHGPAIVRDDGTTSLPDLDTMLSPQAPETGLSISRKWGVKEHIERPEYQWKGQSEEHNSATPFDWERAYLQEKARMEALANEPSGASNSP